MMHRSSRECGHTHLQSCANASWGKPLNPCLAFSNDLVTSSTKPSICVNRLLAHLRRDRRQLLDESPKREKRQTKQKGTLVDAIKMDRLLQQLRTNVFVGTIDPKPHSHYLSEELLQESAKTLMTRAYESKKKESSHFKAALKSGKSTSAIAA
jgi:hypothetical protein